jgi:ribonucleoside-diphosphate reductase alpha chain
MDMAHTPQRRRLPADRDGTTCKLQSGGIEFYLTVNFYPGTADPGELFLTLSKTGTELSGLADSLATTVSVALQYGVPWSVLKAKYEFCRFGSNTTTDDPSIIHAVARAVDRCIESRAALLARQRPTKPPGTAGAPVPTPTPPPGGGEPVALPTPVYALDQPPCPTINCRCALPQMPQDPPTVKCERCGYSSDASPMDVAAGAWRVGVQGKWEHRCADLHPQVGYEPVPPGWLPDPVNKP